MRTTSRKILTVFSLVLVFFAYGLPAGVHFQFCIGDDGHWDIAALSCEPMEVYASTEHIDTEDEHHSDCSDFTFDCESTSKICHSDTFLALQNLPIPIPSVQFAAEELSIPPLSCSSIDISVYTNDYYSTKLFDSITFCRIAHLIQLLFFR